MTINASLIMPDKRLKPEDGGGERRRLRTAPCRITLLTATLPFSFFGTVPEGCSAAPGDMLYVMKCSTTAELNGLTVPCIMVWLELGVLSPSLHSPNVTDTYSSLLYRDFFCLWYFRLILRGCRYR